MDGTNEGEVVRNNDRETVGVTDREREWPTNSIDDGIKDGESNRRKDGGWDKYNNKVDRALIYAITCSPQ